MRCLIFFASNFIRTKIISQMVSNRWKNCETSQFLLRIVRQILGGMLSNFFGLDYYVIRFTLFLDFINLNIFSKSRERFFNRQSTHVRLEFVFCNLCFFYMSFYHFALVYEWKICQWSIILKTYFIVSNLTSESMHYCLDVLFYECNISINILKM